MSESDVSTLMAELEEVKIRQDKQDADLASLRQGIASLRQGIRNTLSVAATAQGSIDTVINELGRLLHGAA